MAVAITFYRLVRDRAFDDEDERFQLTPVGLVEPVDEVISALFRAAFEVDPRPVQRDLGQAGEGPQSDFLDAGLSRRSQRNRLPITGQATVDPKDMDRALFVPGDSGVGRQCG